jgi:hypothetical protein
LAAYSYGADGCDGRDNDYACLYDSLAEFENDRFDDEDERKSLLEDYQGKVNYDELPKNSKMLYMSGGYGWDLTPVSGPQDIISELLAVDWSDLTIIYED